MRRISSSFAPQGVFFRTSVCTHCTMLEVLEMLVKLMEWRPPPFCM